MTQPFILKPENARERMAAAWAFCCRFLELGKACKVTVEECKPTRTLEQNALLWAKLDDIARQVKWPVCDGDGEWEERYLEAEDWKDILTAGLRKHQLTAQGIEGRLVMIGARTSKMTLEEMSELIEFISWFGAEKRVIWGDERKAA